MSKKPLRKNAPALLEAAKAALAYFITDDPPKASHRAERREQVIESLRQTIDACDPKFDDSLVSVELVMTPNTDKLLWGELKKRDDGSEDHEDLLKAVRKGRRETARRIYWKLPIDHDVLRRLKLILDTSSLPGTRDKPFKRFSRQIEEEGLNKNPLALLAQFGL